MGGVVVACVPRLPRLLPRTPARYSRTREVLLVPASVLQGRIKAGRSRRARSREAQGIRDASGLTDADWAQINKLRQALEQCGDKAFQKALADLKKDPSRYLRVMRAFSPCGFETL